MKRMRGPIDRELDGEFIYDVNEERFYDESGRPITADAILDYAFEYHCRDFRPASRLRWTTQRSVRRAIFRSVVGLHDVCLGILANGYGIRLKATRPLHLPFRKYTLTDFERTPPADASQFFGFQSSKGALLWNMVVMVCLFTLAYWLLPRRGLVRIIYDNTALTTATLVFVFVATDLIVPFFLKLAVCALARLKRHTAFC